MSRVGAFVPLGKKPRIYRRGGMWYCVSIRAGAWTWWDSECFRTGCGLTPAFAYEMWREA